MKRFLLFCTLLAALSAGAQIINIPDATFENLLLTSGETYVMIASDGNGFIAVDDNNDGNIDQDEADEVRELYLDNQGIGSLEGIEYFTNLEVLHVSGNSLITLDVTALDDLEELLVNNNQLATLLITDLHHLQTLNCSNNQLGAITFGSMEYLQSVNCSDNNLTQLDFSGCLDLTQLNCANNNITYINIKNGTAQSGSTALNQWGGNTGLAYMCIDDNEAATVNSLLAACGYSTSVVANSFCSFVPGGDYNTITGTLTFDVDNNGCSASDPSQKFMKVTTTIGTETCAAFTDYNGEYNFYTLAGNYTVAPQFEENYFTATATPSSATASFSQVDNTVATVDFCIAPNGTAADIEIVMVPVVAPVPGQEAYYKMVYKNKGNQVLNGSVSCTWDYTKFATIYTNDFSPYATNVQINGNIATYIWDYTNLQPFESRVINFHIEVNEPTDAVPVNVGDVLVFDAEAALTGDALIADNTIQLAQEVVTASMPASITCIEGDNAPVNQIGEYLHYVVNFKNDGAETANNVVVETDLDPAQFDINTLQVLNSSHTATARVNGNTARFIMQAAALAADGNGNILFKAKTKNNLTMGSSVHSVARVYYDYKAAATTNTATTTFAIMGTGNVTQDASVAVYPNPTNGVVNITSRNVIQSVNLYDVQGRLLQTELLNHTEAAINISQRASGIYFIKVYTSAGVKVEKIVKE